MDTEDSRRELIETIKPDYQNFNYTTAKECFINGKITLDQFILMMIANWVADLDRS